MNRDLLDTVLNSPRLPSLPTIALEVIDLVQQKDVNIKQIAATIQLDPALSSKILKTVNSSFYGQSQTISTISHALVVLGLNSVKTLALGFSLVGNLRGAGGDDFDHVTFWKRSLYSAVASRLLAKSVGVVQQEECFLGALLQDLGMLALHQTLDETYATLVRDTGGSHQDLVMLERERLDIDHAEVGGVLAEGWHLPPVLISPIRFHESPDDCPQDLRAMTRCVALGARAADVFISASPGEALEAYYRLAQEWFDLTRERAEPLLADIHKDTVEMRRLFDLPTGELGNADEILARANEALLQITLQSQQFTSELEQQNRQLVHKATTDSLTGAANRGRFNDYINEQFERTRAGGPPLALVFFDADHFKRFNDNYGHQVGDRVLIELASSLQAAMPIGALVARYGGEEFAVVAPETDRVAAAKLAERTRELIEAVTVESDEGETLHITASIGVAIYEGTIFNTADQLIKAADRGVYAAKNSGRNCVRIFTPKPAASRVA